MQTKPVQVLLADDDEDDRLFFKEALEEVKMNTHVRTVNDGVELMDYLTNPQNEKPQIVFLDLNMPLKNGMQCLREIRAHDTLKDQIVAIYSTSAAESDIEETFVQGANVYIRKPNEFGALKKVLEEVICTNWQFHTSGLNKETFLLSL